MLTLESIDQTLVRGASVTVSSTYTEKPELAGITTTLRSKKPVHCNKKGKCAGDHCIGKAVFVNDPTVEPIEGSGWRHGTAKICLTHIIDSDSIPILLPESTVVGEPVSDLVPETYGFYAESREVNEDPYHTGQVLWQDLAHAAADRDTDLLVFLARKLKKENEQMTRQLLDAQARIIGTLS